MQPPIRGLRLKFEQLDCGRIFRVMEPTGIAEASRDVVRAYDEHEGNLVFALHRCLEEILAVLCARATGYFAQVVGYGSSPFEEEPRGPAEPRGAEEW